MKKTSSFLVDEHNPPTSQNTVKHEKSPFDDPEIRELWDMVFNDKDRIEREKKEMEHEMDLLLEKGQGRGTGSWL